MEPLALGSTIGIVGGGQLGRMLAMAAGRLGFRVVILEPEPDCPAAQMANRQITAPYDDAGALDELAAEAECVTYEFENVPVAAIRRLEGVCRVFPDAQALAIAQDRLTEKRFLAGLDIAVAASFPVDTVEELQAGLTTLGGTGILKTRRFGYDGKGQFRIERTSQAPEAFAALGGGDLILEEVIDFEREFSVIAVRGADGSFTAYDPAWNIHEDGILRRSTVPAGLTREQEDIAHAIARTIVNGLTYVGVIGMECFLTREGWIKVNEIAPRVHNSGHWTEAACLVSQFENHIRAICGWKLGATSRHGNCVMTNIIGDEIAQAATLASEAGTLLHIYGKKAARLGRKMGHYIRMR